jgi:DNA-binding NtrC family response regulator
LDTKIAIVDDEPDLLDAYSKMLANLGFPKPALFTNGTSLINALASGDTTFDVILMDYRIPEMNGLEAAKIVRRYRPAIKIILATASPAVEEQAVSEGFFFLQKPFSKNALVEDIKKILGPDSG